MMYTVILVALFLAWDASRRWAERNDEFDPEDMESLWDHVHAVEELAAKGGRDLATLHAARENQSEHLSTLLAFSDKAKDRLDDHTRTLANHAQNLQTHGQALTATGLMKIKAGQK